MKKPGKLWKLVLYIGVNWWTEVDMAPFKCCSVVISTQLVASSWPGLYVNGNNQVVIVRYKTSFFGLNQSVSQIHISVM